MKKRRALSVPVIALIAGLFTVGAVMMGFIPPPPKENSGDQFSVETTTMGRFLDTPCTRKLFAGRLGAGDMVNNPNIFIVRRLTLRKLSEFPMVDLNDLKLKAIQAELVKLDPLSPGCQINHHA